MNEGFLVFTTSHFDRELKNLVAYHPHLKACSLRRENTY